MARRLGHTHTAVWKILNREKFHPFHFQKVQSITELDPQHRLNFCRIAVEKLRSHPNFFSTTLFTDEATFTRDGILNFHNMHYWSQDNPHVISKKGNQWGFSINVWCGIIGMKQFFLEVKFICKKIY